MSTVGFKFESCSCLLFTFILGRSKYDNILFKSTFKWPAVSKRLSTSINRHVSSAMGYMLQWVTTLAKSFMNNRN